MVYRTHTSVRLLKESCHNTWTLRGKNLCGNSSNYHNCRQALEYYPYMHQIYFFKFFLTSKYLCKKVLILIFFLRSNIGSRAINLLHKKPKYVMKFWIFVNIQKSSKYFISYEKMGQIQVSFKNQQHQQSIEYKNKLQNTLNISILKVCSGWVFMSHIFVLVIVVVIFCWGYR